MMFYVCKFNKNFLKKVGKYIHLFTTFVLWMKIFSHTLLRKWCFRAPFAADNLLNNN